MAPVLAVIAVIAAASAATALYRHFHDDVASVERYQHALGVLRQVTRSQVGGEGQSPGSAPSPTPAHVRVVPRAGSSAAPASVTPAPVTPAPMPAPAPAPVTAPAPMPAPMPAPAPAPVTAPASVPAPPVGAALVGVAGRTSRHRFIRATVGSQLRRRVPVVGLVALAAVVTIILSTVGLRGAGRSPARSPVRHPVASGSTSKVQRVTTPTTAVAPAPTTVALASASAGAVSYTLSARVVSLQLSDRSACWIELRSGTAEGQVLFSGTLTPGVRRLFDETVGVWMRLGNPRGIDVAVDGQQVSLPPTASPLDVSLVTA